MPRAAKEPFVDHYARLHVSPRAGQEVIQAAYRALMRLHHPDAKETKGVTAQDLNQAYGILSDKDKRRDYDRERNRIDGKVIEGYRIVKKIAEGGFGTTYVAEHVLTGEPVCFKHCHDISADSDAILVNEAKAMWDLRHYAIPAVRSVVRLEDDSLALVMSYIPGPTLAKVIEKNKRVDAEHVAWIAERVLNALSYMHHHGVIHGDLKPQNIIVQPDSHMVAVVDFGLAMVKPGATARSIGYTEGFAPPEQLDGRVLLPSSDYYSLGMTMLFALSGDIDHLVRKEVPDDVPAPLCAFVERLIVRDPLSRPDWETANLWEELKDVREKSFGRRRSNMKPLKV